MMKATVYGTSSKVTITFLGWQYRLKSRSVFGESDTCGTSGRSAKPAALDSQLFEQALTKPVYSSKLKMLFI